MRTFSLVLFFSLSLAAFADKVVVNQTVGQTTYHVSAIQELAFDGKGVSILFTDGQSVYFAAETLDKIAFSANPSVVGSVKNAGKAITLQGNTVTVVGGEPCDIKVLSAAGKVVVQSRGTTLDISALPGGVYVVQAGGLISKIVKR